MITFLSSPKGFTGVSKENQYRAIQSWLASTYGAEVILFGDSSGIDEAGRDLGVKVVKEIAAAPSGPPYFGAIAEYAAEHARHDLQIYLNCDILLRGTLEAMRRITFDQFLLVGQRIDLSEGVYIDLTRPDWKRTLEAAAQAGGAKLHDASGIDYFGFRRGLWEGLPPIIIGRAGYDNALMAYCLRRRIPIVDATGIILALHQFHDYRHVAGQKQTVFLGEDARSNMRHAGGPHSSTMVADATYRLTSSGIDAAHCRGDRLREVEIWLRYVKGYAKASLALRAVWRIRHMLRGRADKPVTLEEILQSV